MLWYTFGLRKGVAAMKKILSKYPSLKIYFIPTVKNDVKLMEEIERLSKLYGVSKSEIGMMSLRLGFERYKTVARRVYGDV